MTRSLSRNGGEARKIVYVVVGLDDVAIDAEGGRGAGVLEARAGNARHVDGGGCGDRGEATSWDDGDSVLDGDVGMC